MPKDVSFVQLDSGEDANSVRDRLSFFRGQHVLIIWPEEGTALTRKLDLVLIQREAMRRAIRLAFVTHDPQIVEHARDLDISTFETIGASERGRWQRGRAKVFTNRWQRPKDEPSPQDLMPVASRVRSESRIPLPTIVRVVIVLAVLGLLLGTAYIVVPGATITITLSKIPIQAEVLVEANPNLTSSDVDGGRIPSRYQLVQVTQSGTRPTTGSLDQTDTLASGTITVLNRGDAALTIPAETIVSTSDGNPVLFRTLTDALLPGGINSSVEISVEALSDYAGVVGNVGALKINVIEADFASQVTLSNLLPLSGGQDRSLPIVTQTDRERLRAAVRQQIQAVAQSEIQALLGADEFIVDETIAITGDSERDDWQTYSAEVGDVASEISLEMRAVVQAMIINQRDAERLAFTALSRNIPRGRTLDATTIEYTRGPIEALGSDGEVGFRMSASGLVDASVNPAELQQILAGRSIEDARLYLNSTLELVPGSQPDIRISPDFDGTLPRLPVRITVRVISISP